MDAAGFLTMTVLSARFAVAFSEEAEAAWQSAALASCQHVLPLLIMAISVSWYASIIATRYTDVLLHLVDMAETINIILDSSACHEAQTYQVS